MGWWLAESSPYASVAFRIHLVQVAASAAATCTSPDVAECTVVGVADALKGEVPLGLVVLTAGVEREHEIIVGESIEKVRAHIGPVASFKIATVVERLPKTRSGKILQGTIRRIASGSEYRTPATIDDPAILDEMAVALKNLGYPS